MDDNYGVIQVVVPPPIQAPLREWLASRGLHLYPIPVEDDLPTYGVERVSDPEPSRSAEAVAERERIKAAGAVSACCGAEYHREPGPYGRWRCHACGGECDLIGTIG